MKYIDENNNIVEANSYREAAKALYGEEFYQNPGHKNESLISTLALDYQLPVTAEVYQLGDKQGTYWGVSAATPIRHTLRPYGEITSKVDFIYEGTGIVLDEESYPEYRSDSLNPHNWVNCWGSDIYGNRCSCWYYVSDEDMGKELDCIDIDYRSPNDVILMEEVED